MPKHVNKILGYNKIADHYDIAPIEGDNAPNPEGDNAPNPEGDNAHCSLRGKHASWQIEMDKYVFNLRKQFNQKYGMDRNFPKFKWQKSFHDHIIRNKRDYDNHWNYTMYNFRKHGLPDNWKYTGLKYPEMIDEI